jgi:CHAD domain-containing protein
MPEGEETERSGAMPDLCSYGAEVTAERLDKMLTHLDGVRKAEEIEPVHQMRVWSRRSRAALEIFEICFPARGFREIEREVKAATDALSEARDLDVMVENLEQRAAKLPMKQRAGILSFVARLKDQREKRQKSVIDAVNNLESHNLSQQFRDLVAKAAAAKAHESEERSPGAAANGNRGGKRRGSGKKGKRHG